MRATNTSKSSRANVVLQSDSEDDYEDVEDDRLKIMFHDISHSHQQFIIIHTNSALREDIQHLEKTFSHLGLEGTEGKKRRRSVRVAEGPQVRGQRVAEGSSSQYSSGSEHGTSSHLVTNRTRQGKNRQKKDIR